MAKPAEILTGLRAQFSDKMLSRTQAYDWIFWQNNEPSTQLIIWSYSNTNYRQTFSRNDKVNQSKACPLHDNMHPHALTAEHWRKCIKRYCHILPIALTWHRAIFTCSVHSKGP